MYGENLELVIDAGCANIKYLFNDQGQKLYEITETWATEKLDEKSGTWEALDGDDSVSEWYSPCVEACEADAGYVLEFRNIGENMVVANSKDGHPKYMIRGHITLYGDPSGKGQFRLIDENFDNPNEALSAARTHYNTAMEKE